VRSTDRFLVLLALGLALSPPAAAADLTFMVNTTTDDVDANPGDGVCATSGGLCTLRAAVMESNHTASGTVEIRVPASASPYVLTIGPSGLGDEASGHLKVTRAVTITGGGAAHTIVDGDGADRVFEVRATSTLSGLTIENGFVAGSGGGVYADGGTITLSRSVVTANTASGAGGIGGGIAASSVTTLVLDRSTVSGNHATILGGGVSAYKVTISNSTISDNVVGFEGGGVLFFGSENASIFYSTIAGNWSESDAGGNGAGGGIYLDAGDVTIVGSVIADNLETVSNKPYLPYLSPSDCRGSFLGTMTSIVGTTSHCTITALVADPLLGPLQLNGGDVPTRALLAGSPAIDPYEPYPCQFAPPTDQRGAHRPSGSHCDIGAYEWNANGDVNGDGKRDVSDVFYFINTLFAGGAAPSGLGDVNGDTQTDIADVFFLINFLFAGGPAPL
jgi:CSLREA domain-containing protein